MKLAIIMSPRSVMPSLSGGGVERLCRLYLSHNDAAAEPHEIIVVARRDAKATENELAHTRYIYVDVTKSEPMSNVLESRLRRRSMRYDYARGVVAALKGEALDAVLLENCAELAPLVRKKLGVRPILHAHDRFFGKDRPGWHWDIANVERIIFVSEFLKNAAIRCGVEPEICRVVHNCVDTAEFDASLYADIRAEKRAKYGLSERDKLGVFVGRLIPEKGALELLKALDLCEDKSIKLLIVGSAEYGEDVRDEYREQLESAAPTGRIVFIGSVKNASAARFLARADFAVVPSVFDEPAGLPVLEALSSALPVIVSDAGGIHEYTEGCAAVTTVSRGLGYVASLSRAMDELASKLDAGPFDGESARAHAKKFAVGDYCAALNAVLGE